MRISYCGQMKDTTFNTRAAEIDFTEEEWKIIDVMQGIAEKETQWKHWSGFDGSIFISVQDREDYNNFKDFYMETKKLLKDREKSKKSEMKENI